MNFADDPLVSSEVRCDQAKVISIGKSYKRGGFVITVEFVAKLFSNVFQLEEHRIKDHEKHCGTKWIPLNTYLKVCLTGL